jgi:LPS export ABC transporter protein LptC
MGQGGCGGGKETLPIGGDSVTTPYQEFGKTTMFFYDGAFKRWRLESSYMRKNLDDSAGILVVPVVLTLYDSLGRTGTRVLSDSGTTTSSMSSFTVWGDVYVKTEDGLVIRTEKLWWNRDSRKVYSDAHVQVTTAKGDVLRGKGMEAQEDFSRWSFKSEVSGEFPDFRERVEQDDDFL